MGKTILGFIYSSLAKYHKDMNLGEVIRSSPAAEKVIEKYFGKGCFTCPGMKTPSIWLAVG